MKLSLVMNVRFPTEKAHGWQIAKMCEALMRAGVDIELVVPDRRNPIEESASSYYKLDSEIPTVRLPIINLLQVKWFPRFLAFAIEEFSFLFSFMRFARKRGSGILLTRDHYLASRKKISGWKIFFEGHDISRNFFRRYRRMARIVDGIVFTNRWKADTAIEQWGEGMREKILVLPNAIDIKPYHNLPDKTEAKRRLGWDVNHGHVVYVGHLYQWKGVHVLADASKHLSDHFRVMIVGGTEKDQTALSDYIFENQLDRVTLIPHVPQQQVPEILTAADVLALPNSAKSWNSRYTTSPIKLWEYLAAKRPVVASDLPALRELVSDKEVYYVTPDDPLSLAKGIMAQGEGGGLRVEAGWEAALQNSWEERTRRLLEFLGL